ncbi:mitochondrial substrate carrier [Heterobasidion irregulare TC 32-1]|uniref:Mitochondrial substrate carrier n=1 Tax=Heterobasidion irregulare (strain TC 32-1) TaxID=747525 RepID=W4KPC3_HETIT|nr:mitochondrial substrate carrier [Heterobasidion irregulare TC 32-1]ETW87693.1 mitochondrial substrate carrier [Heterobasidion irregulare TC 32-1]
MKVSPHDFGRLGVAACCTHPLDLTKVRMQTVQFVSGSSRISTVTVLRTTIAESGVRSLYTGLTASILRQMTYSLVRLGSYEKMKFSLSRDRQPSPSELLLAAMAAGGLGGVAGNPADILLVRMTSDSTRPPEKRYNYSNALTGLVSLIRNEGVGGLTRGLGTNTLRAILMNGSQVGSYDFFKVILLHRSIPIVNYQLQDNLLLHTIASCMAGTVATTVCAPADVIRSRIMSQSGQARPIDVLRQSLRDEGPRFLFKGWTPAFVRLGPNTVFLFVFYEQLKKGWDTTFAAR